MKRLAAALLALPMMMGIAQAREVTSIDEGWYFSKGFIKQGLIAGKTLGANKLGDPVTLPHTFNDKDYTESDYYRGYGTYTKTLSIPEDYIGKRVFLKFEGAGTVADVVVNSTFVGEHKGAYNAFTFEITDFIKAGDNSLQVICSNAPNFEVAPYGGDFAMYGGLYRDAWLEVMEPTCISPLYYGSDGVLISQKNVSKDRADITAEVHLSTLSDYDGCEVRFEMKDAEGKTVASTFFSNIFSDVITLNTHIDTPHLWNGKNDPYLYTTVTTLLKDGKEIDRVEDTFGIRWYTVDGEKGFFLNGEHIKLHGVSRHQEWAGLVNALKEENHRTDFDFFDEMGVNALRLAHYPQAHFMFYEADRRGFVVWEEIPFVGTWIPNPKFDENLELQLRELIAQNYNHPSICFWGLYNEIQAGTDEIVSKLNDIAHSMDPYRLTTCAAHIDSSNALISDVMGWNKYFGWYEGQKDGLSTFIDNWHQVHPTARIGISEYGGGACYNMHVGKYDESKFTVMDSMGKNHPMERQTAIHMAQWKVIAERDWIWGSFVWNMFDFGAPGRFEGDTPNQNDKGLVTRDRQTRKDAFYFYKANWNKSVPTVHLCSKNYTERAEDTTDIILFTTAPSAKLYLNGKLISNQKTDSYATIIWPDVKLQKGTNAVLIKTAQGDESAEWTVK